MASFVGTMRAQPRKTISIACLVFLPLAAATDALAARSVSAQTTLNQPPQVVVRYDDLNLSSDAGAKVLLHRLERAARQVCENPYETRTLAQLSVIHRCYAQSLERAIEVVGAQKLTTAYQSKYRLASRKFTLRTPG
jgi:UrcA family protein